jgi:hypothetical protein
MNKPLVIALSGAALIVGLAAVPSVSNAQAAPAPTPVAQTKPNFSSMMFLTGTWTCTQQLRGKQRPDTSTTTISMDGMWMVSQDSAPPFDQYRTWTLNGTGYTGYDSTLKQWVTLGVDSGGGYGMQSSPGWQGNTITWTGKNIDGTPFTDVITKISDTETSDVSTTTDPKGNVTKTTIHCTKSGS